MVGPAVQRLAPLRCDPPADLPGFCDCRVPVPIDGQHDTLVRHVERRRHRIVGAKLVAIHDEPREQCFLERYLRIEDLDSVLFVLRRPAWFNKSRQTVNLSRKYVR